MPLYGTLNSMPLPGLLRWLAASGQSGNLRFERERVRRWIVFRDGAIVACASDDPPERLGHFLLSRGKITENQLRIALASQDDTSSPLGKVLVEMGALRQSDLSALLESKAAETLFSVFEMTGASFKFEEGDTEVPGAFPVGWTVEQLIERGKERSDEVARIREVIRDSSVVLRRTKNLPPAAILANGMIRTIFAAIDGAKTVHEILLHVHGSEFLVSKFLYELQRAGFVEVVGGETADSPETQTECADSTAPTATPSRPDSPAAPAPVAVTPAAAASSVSAPAATTQPVSTSASPSPAHGPAASAPEPIEQMLDTSHADSPVAPAPGQEVDADDDTLANPEMLQESSDVEALEESDAYQAESRLEAARKLLTTGEYAQAFAALDDLCREFPEDDSLRRLIAEAEATFRDKAYRHYLPADLIPTLKVPLEEIESRSLSPSEFFLLSRIDGSWNLKSIVKIAPIREIEALLILKRMREEGLIELVAEAGRS